ncbi:IS200/IS605 family element transposase accessory protein TnpB, partial [bacterium]|nr:IS200/IS605 family element transposase accessory protein TnpB [bacterium]
MQRIHYLVLTMELNSVKAARYKKVVSIDLGEIHPITTTDGKETKIYNGRLIRSRKRYREKLKPKFAKQLTGGFVTADNHRKCKKYSKRWRQLTKSKNKQLRRLNNSLKDARHKVTRHFANFSKKNRVGIVVIGDLTNIRDNIDYGNKANLKLHQWEFAEIKRQLKYKLEDFGIEVKGQDEESTTKSCPSCGKRNVTNNRNYKCTNPLCRFS